MLGIDEVLRTRCVADRRRNRSGLNPWSMPERGGGVQEEREKSETGF